MFCKNCGKQISDDANFCPCCGYGVLEDDGSHCPNCGAEIAADANFCSKCGKTLGPDTQTNYITPQNTNTYAQNAQTQETSTIGILAIIFGAMGGWLGLLFAIIGLCIYKKPENKQKCYIGLGLFLAWVVIAGLIMATAF